MEKFLILSFAITILSPPISADTSHFCNQDHTGDFKICGYSDVITFVSKTGENSQLSLNLENFSGIAPHTFNNLRLHSLELFLPDSRNCTPRFLKLVPESLDGLSVDNLALRCLKLTVNPNPFKKLVSLTELFLQRVESTETLQNFLTGFPHVEWLKLEDLDIATISAHLFSGMNEELRIISIYHGFSVVEVKSFDRFHHLQTLELIEGQLSDLQSGTFDGLDHLQYLHLGSNKINVLRKNIFNNLPNLQFLYLHSNAISEIEAGTFTGSNLRQIWLGDNMLVNLPTGVFQNLEYLEFLSLEGNKIRTVPYNVFEGCVKLRRLDLHSNEIHHIDANAFWGLHLKSLDLASNNLTILEHDSFSGLEVDYSLDLRGNNLIEIQPRVFRNLIAGNVSLCYHYMSQFDKERWGGGDSIGQLIIDCDGK